MPLELVVTNRPRDAPKTKIVICTYRLGGSAFETLTHKYHRPPAVRWPPAFDSSFTFEPWQVGALQDSANITAGAQATDFAQYLL